MIRILTLKRLSESLKKKNKEFGFRSLFFFFSNKMEHPQVKCSLLFLIVLVTSNLARTKLLSWPRLALR